MPASSALRSLAGRERAGDLNQGVIAALSRPGSLFQPREAEARAPRRRGSNHESISGAGVSARLAILQHFGRGEAGWRAYFKAAGPGEAAAVCGSA